MEKAFNNLANAAFMRSNGTWTKDKPASESDKQWAKDCWPFPMNKEGIEGAKGTLGIRPLLEHMVSHVRLLWPIAPFVSSNVSGEMSGLTPK